MFWLDFEIFDVSDHEVLDVNEALPPILDSQQPKVDYPFWNMFLHCLNAATDLYVAVFIYFAKNEVFFGVSIVICYFTPGILVALTFHHFDEDNNLTKTAKYLDICGCSFVAMILLFVTGQDEDTHHIMALRFATSIFEGIVGGGVQVYAIAYFPRASIMQYVSVFQSLVLTAWACYKYSLMLTSHITDRLTTLQKYAVFPFLITDMIFRMFALAIILCVFPKVLGILWIFSLILIYWLVLRTFSFMGEKFPTCSQITIGCTLIFSTWITLNHIPSLHNHEFWIRWFINAVVIIPLFSTKFDYSNPVFMCCILGGICSAIFWYVKTPRLWKEIAWSDDGNLGMCPVTGTSIRSKNHHLEWLNRKPSYKPDAMLASLKINDKT